MLFNAKNSRSLSLLNGVQKKVRCKIAEERILAVKEEPVKTLRLEYAGTLSDRNRVLHVTEQAEDDISVIEYFKLRG